MIENENPSKWFDTTLAYMYCTAFFNNILWRLNVKNNIVTSLFMYDMYNDMIYQVDFNWIACIKLILIENIE